MFLTFILSSCWAFAAAGALEAALFKSESKSIIVSPQRMVDCDYEDHGCDGGNSIKCFWNFIFFLSVISYLTVNYKFKLLILLPDSAWFQMKITHILENKYLQIKITIIF